MTHAALPHLLIAAKDKPREVADIVNISSIAGRQAWANFAAYNMTKFGVNGFTEAGTAVERLCTQLWDVAVRVRERATLLSALALGAKGVINRSEFKCWGAMPKSVRSSTF